MRFIYLCFLLLNAAILSAQTFAPYCFSKNKKDGKPLFNFEDTIIIYIPAHHLVQHPILQNLPQSNHTWAGKKWVRISLNANTKEQHQHQLWQNWAITAELSYKSNNNKHKDSVSYIFSPYFAVALNQNQYKTLLRAPKDNPKATTISFADKKNRIATLQIDSANLAIHYTKANTECNVFKNQFQKDINAFYDLLKTNNVNISNFESLVSIDENINQFTEEYLIKASPEIGRKVADFTSERVKKINTLNKDEQKYLAQYEKIAQFLSSRVDICSQALELKSKLDIVTDELKLLLE